MADGASVFAEVVHGAKRWFLAPPEYQPRFSPDETSYRWLHLVWPTYTEAERDMILECTVYPNEVCTARQLSERREK